MEQEPFWARLVSLEPAVWRGLVMAIVAVLASFGVYVSSAIPDSIIGLIVITIPIIQALWTKKAVTPNVKVVTYLPDPSEPAEILPGEAVTTASPQEIVEASIFKGNVV